MTVAEGKRVNLSRFPNFHRSGVVVSCFIGKRLKMRWIGMVLFPETF